ncbi:Gfo/Idh/MocA family oxidoreductase [Georgenia satyanarayanai]|uniref:Gfo/Idh/MocA family oxidoreductase n=1 Tax=Georgenia satyanarayanai TaxID=860221 RepID=UPI00203DF226|nr:Gfo/Idh/MocA family oxidoreductase [Georgenia satyanarayanai]MCM3661518.1 Gfo/Idh/MocA family oxidoreductase [Georgenia satyanarayanai]
MSQAELLRVGVVGLGAMGAEHVVALSEHVPGARVVAVHDVDAHRARKVAASVGARVAGSAEGLIADAEVDAVVIASPDHTHAPLTLACLAAGKPVLCEKPLGVGVAETAQVVAAEEAAGRQLVTVGFMRRFDPGYLELREAVLGGRVGEPVLLHCVHRNASPHPEATTEGVVGNSMVHELDILPWLTGLPVTGIEVRSPRTEGLREPQLAVVELGGGRVLATVEVFLSARYGYDVRCEVVGTEGAVSLRPPARLDVARDGRAGVAVAADFRERFAEAYRAELTAWVAAASRGGATGASAEDGHRAAVVAAAGIESLATGRRVAVPPG